MATTRKTSKGGGNGNGIRETLPGKFVATMYDPRVRGKTRQVGTFTAPPQPNPQYRTRREAERAAKRAKADAEDLRDLQMKGTPGGETVHSFADRWMRDYPTNKRGQVRGGTTKRHNNERVKAFVKDFGDRLLHEVTAQEARAWTYGGIVPPELRSVAKHWHGAVVESDGDVRAKSNTGRHIAIRTMYNDAIGTGPPVWIGEKINPFGALGVPEPEGRRGDAITILSPDELGLLVETAMRVLGDYGVHFGALIETLAWTGMRPGEAWALHCERSSTYNWIDWEQGELHVKYQIDRFIERRHTKWDKKGKGRVVYLLPPAERAFKRAIEGRPNGPVFYTTRGLPMNSASAFYYWSKVRPVFWSKLPDERRSSLSEKRGGPEPGKIAVDFDLYEMRHVFGTRLAEMGMTPPEIADQLGHKDGGKLAMERYIHPRKESVKRSMRERYDEWEWREEKRRREDEERKAAGE